MFLICKDDLYISPLFFFVYFSGLATTWRCVHRFNYACLQAALHLVKRALMNEPPR